MIDFGRYFPIVVIIPVKQRWHPSEWATIQAGGILGYFSQTRAVSGAVRKCLIIPNQCTGTEDKKVPDYLNSLLWYDRLSQPLHL